MEKEYFEFYGRIIHWSQVESAKDIRSGSCWGKLKLKGEPEMDVGDGSYYGDGRHTAHTPLNFKRFEKWFSQFCVNGSKLFVD